MGKLWECENLLFNYNMSMNYDLADILNRIVVGGRSYNEIVNLRVTKLSMNVVKLLSRQGIIVCF